MKAVPQAAAELVLDHGGDAGESVQGRDRTGSTTPGPSTPGSAAPGLSATGLSERDQRILEFERQWWKFSGAKDEAIRELFDFTPTRYYQVLNALLDDRAALAFDPMLVKRLQRMRATRTRERSERRMGAQR